MTADAELLREFFAYLEAHAAGEARAKTGRIICAALGLPTTHSGRRVLRALAHAAIESGELVCATGKGYLIPASIDEAEGTVARLRSEAGEIMQRARLTSQLARDRFSLTPPPASADEFLAALRGA